MIIMKILWMMMIDRIAGGGQAPWLMVGGVAVGRPGAVGRHGGRNEAPGIHSGRHDARRQNRMRGGRGAWPGARGRMMRTARGGTRERLAWRKEARGGG